MSRPTRSVVAVSGDPQRPELEALLFGVNDCDVVFVESMADAYSRIKQVTPDMIVVLSEIDDVAACQLLSMLKVDGNLTRTLVLTCPAGRLTYVFDDSAAEQLDDWPSSVSSAIQMN